MGIPESLRDDKTEKSELYGTIRNIVGIPETLREVFRTIRISFPVRMVPIGNGNNWDLPGMIRNSKG